MQRNVQSAFNCLYMYSTAMKCIDMWVLRRTDMVQPFTPEEARSLLNAMKGDRLEARCSVAIALGLRQGEARN